ncbi:MAG: carbon storage regulator CsrA [Oscillospiraceae bacterium]
MLILTRKPGQGFTVGDDIEITITEISGDKVRVGINAPKEVKILRLELSETVEENQQAANKADAGALRALADGLKKQEENK